MLKSTEKSDAINSISNGSVFEGNLTSSGDVRVDGKLIGSIKTGGRLVLGENGIIEGDVCCENAIVAGEIKGTINTSELLTLRSTAKLNGEIITIKLAIEPGAVFSGKCSMGPVVKNIKPESNPEINTKEKTA